MKAYGQNSEDLRLKEYFEGEDPSSLTVLDIGANDGRTFSNSLLVIEMGWNACLVEPSPKALEKLTAEHIRNTRVHIFPYAISKFTGQATFYESGTLLNIGDVALVSTLNAAETRSWKSVNVVFEPTTVQCKTFGAFLMDSPIKRFDAITIDCEGEDLDILRQMNLGTLGCRFLIVEFNGKDQSLYEIYASHFGMKLIHTNPENLIFVMPK
jgi:FkbM family methyltransferase